MATAKKVKLNKNARAWVKALRSGKYKQTKNVLTRVDPNTGEILGNCCLGVACELALKAGLPLKVKTVGELIQYDNHESFLPESVQNWLGLRKDDGAWGTDAGSNLTSRNDGAQIYSIKPQSFKQIARIIEQKAAELFV